MRPGADRRTAPGERGLTQRQEPHPRPLPRSPVRRGAGPPRHRAHRGEPSVAFRERAREHTLQRHRIGRAEQQTPHHVQRLRRHPRVPAQRVRQVHPVHRQFQHPRHQEIRQQHRITVPGHHHPVHRFRGQPGRQFPPGRLQHPPRLGRVRPPLRHPHGSLHPVGVHRGGEPHIRRVVPRGRHQGARPLRRVGVQHHQDPVQSAHRVHGQRRHVPGRTPRRQYRLLLRHTRQHPTQNAHLR